MEEEESDEFTSSAKSESTSQSIFVRVMVRDEMVVGGDSIGGDDMKNKRIDRES